jgi:hypothetical protein
MSKLSHLLRFRATRFSPWRREGATHEVHAPLRGLDRVLPFLPKPQPQLAHRGHAAASSTRGRARPGMPGMAMGAARLDGEQVVATEAEGAASNEAAAGMDGGASVTSVARVHAEESAAGNAESGVYVLEHARSGEPTKGKTMIPILEQVTLVVYGWKSVEPGTLSWVFPSVGAAVAAARAMKNAVRWAIVAGRREAASEDEGLEEARAHGAVLIEQAG